MGTTTVTVLDPRSADAAELDAVLEAAFAARLATAAVDWPHEPPPTQAEHRASVLAPWTGDPALLVTLTDDAGALLANGVVELPSWDNPHVALLDPHVTASARGHGLGRELVTASARVAADHGRRLLVGECDADTPLEELWRAVGAEPALVEVQRDLDVPSLDAGRLRALRDEAAAHADGYVLTELQGPVPPELREDVAAVMLSLNDAPLGELDYDDERWDAARVEARDRYVTTADLRLHTIVAHTADGAPAGYTEVAVRADGALAWQWGTGVVPAHRGHRLGMLLKTEMLLMLLEEEPALVTVSTWNAEDNEHMIAVNEALGCTVVSRWTAWQLPVAPDGTLSGGPAGG